MSLSARAGTNANAGLLVNVLPGDLPGDDALAGVELQRSCERAAYAAGGGAYVAPAQLVADFLRRLRPDIAVERLAAEVPPRYMANPARSWRRDDGSHLRPDDIARLVAQRLSSRD
jgi:uncharacterized FAD-dependent dehydrogenase